MKDSTLKLSDKYQLVIPLSARKKMALNGQAGQRFRVTKVTKNSIVFEKEPSLEDFLGKCTDLFVPNATNELRKQRDQDWE